MSDDAQAPSEPTPDRQPRGQRPRGSSRSSDRRAHLEEASPSLREEDFLRGAGGSTTAGNTPSTRPDRRPASRPSPSAPARRAAPTRERERDRRPRREADIAPDINAEEVELAAQALDDILRILEIDAEITIREPLTPGEGLGSARAVIDVNGTDLGVLIGRRGDTLASIQHVLNLIVAKRIPDAAGVTVDVEHYRHRREEQLGSLALRMADRVRRTGSPITLEPMPASDRRLIHLTLADDPDVQTYSIGEGDARKVVLAARD